MSKHKALELAHDLEIWARLYATTDYTDEMANNSAAELRAQHALIVQMRDGMRAVDSIDVHASMTVQEADAISDQFEAALAAADQYLGEQA